MRKLINDNAGEEDGRGERKRKAGEVEEREGEIEESVDEAMLMLRTCVARESKSQISSTESIIQTEVVVVLEVPISVPR